MNISNRIFGSDFDEPIKKKLEARQLLAAGPSPNEPITTQEDFDNSNPYNTGIGHHHNFNGAGELSSRKPWARMWTAVSLYQVDNSDPDNPVKNDPLDIKVYCIGNNVYKDYFKNESVGDSVQKDFLNENEFMKANAGITSITSDVAGYLGTVKNTTVNFKVNNFNDFEKIFTKYFLYPGALVFVDVGWDTSHIYHPEEELQHKGTLDHIEDLIFGSPDSPTGVVQKSQGDMDCFMGFVTKYDAKSKPDGTFECSVQIISKNYAVMDHQQDGRTKYADKIRNEITHEALKRIAEKLGLDTMSDLDWIIKSKEGNDWRKAVAKSVASQESAEEDGTKYKYPVIPSTAYDVGVYFQYLDDEDDKDVPDLNNNLYMTWWYFENFLNKILGVRYENPNNNAGFNSNGQLITFNENLLKKQNYTKNLSSLSFLYPNTDKVQGRVNNSWDNPIKRRTYDISALKKQNQVPMDIIFVNVSVIESAFATNDDVKSAINQILTTISEESVGCIDLKLMEINNGKEFAVVDFNNPVINANVQNFKERYDESLQEEAAKETKKFDDLFIFKPYSPNSIISTIDLGLSTPNGAMANMVAIQGLTGEQKVFPSSENILQGLAVKELFKEDNDIFWQHVPKKEEEVNQIEEEQKEDVPIPEELPDDFLDDSDNSQLIDNIDKVYKGTSKDAKDYAKKLKEEYNTAVSASNVIKIEKDSAKLEEQPPEGALVAKSATQYFEYKIKKHEVDNPENNKDILLPYDVSFSIYGISGIFPGNSFKIDYMPKAYLERTYFTLTKVSQEISSGTWRTSLAGQMRLRSDKAFANGKTPIPTPKILMSKKALTDLGYQPEQCDEIWDNDLNWEEVQPIPPPESEE